MRDKWTRKGEEVSRSKNTLEFTTVAAEYCAFLRKPGPATGAYLQILQRLLPLLYLKASLIEDFDPFEEWPGRKFVTEADYHFILSLVSKNLGAKDQYLPVYNPEGNNPDPDRTTLSECLTDIYQELADFIQLFRTGEEEAMQEAVWECRRSFWVYWGPRAVSALATIHHLLHTTDSDAESL